MSVYETELRKRLQSHEPIKKTRKWFLACLDNQNEPIEWSDLSKLEQMFLKDAVDAIWSVEKYTVIELPDRSVIQGSSPPSSTRSE